MSISYEMIDNMARHILPLTGMERLLKKSGAERVAEPAKVAFREVLEDYAEDIGVKAIRFAKHSGRKTVKSEDVKAAVK